MIESLLENKYAVALSDYEGLGASGSHPYLEPRTAAFNTIDAVRAMRDISPTVSTRWIALGYSQGGQAVWAANELNSYYGNDLQLQGSVALAPAVNVTGAAQPCLVGFVDDSPTDSLSDVIIGLARYNPDLDEHSFLHGLEIDYRRQLSHCELPRNESNKTQSAQFPSVPIPWQSVVDRLREARDRKPDTPQDTAMLQDALRKAALPQRPLNKPMLVISGKDDALAYRAGFNPPFLAAAYSADKSSTCRYRTPTIATSYGKLVERSTVGSAIVSPGRPHRRIALRGRSNVGSRRSRSPAGEQLSGGDLRPECLLPRLAVSERTLDEW